MHSVIRTAVACCVAMTLASPAMATNAPELGQKAVAVLSKHCYRCHGQDGTNEGGVNYITDARQLVRRGKVVTRDPTKSKLFKRLTSTDDPMPPEEEKVRPTADEIAIVREWIEAGAPDTGSLTPPAKGLSPAEIVAVLRNDLETVPVRDRRYVRYFTLAHLANAGLSGDEMQSYRHGLSKLVNSLSWGPRVVVPRAVDRGATLFRIDLRDYQWNEKTWDAVLAANPYSVDPRTVGA